MTVINWIKKWVHICVAPISNTFI